MLLHVVLRSGVVAALGAFAARPAETALAQSRILDEGTFVISRRGAPSQTESFRIRADGSTITATGQVSGGSNRVSSSLTTDSLGTPIEYHLEVREGNAATMSISAIGRSGRLTVRAQLPHGDESTREYPIVAAHTIILDDDLLHQLVFALRPKGGVRVISPRTGRGAQATLRSLGNESINIAGRQLSATHYSLQVAGPSGRQEDFWTDAAGHLLQVDIASIGLKAVREELPR